MLGAKRFGENENVSLTYRGQVRTEDGFTKHAIIKDLPLLELCNELLAYTLAVSLNLPTPECHLGLVNGGALHTKEAPTTTDGCNLVFISIDVKTPNLTTQIKNTNNAGKKQIVSHLTKWKSLSHVYAFDTWVANIDRHAGNLLFGGKDEIWIIDHGYCFTGPNWASLSIDPNKPYRNRMSEWLTKLLSDNERVEKAKEVPSFVQLLENFDAAEIFNSSYINKLLPIELVEVLKDFLQKRVSKVSPYTTQALGVPSFI